MRGHRVIARSRVEIASLTSLLSKLFDLSADKFIEKPQKIIDHIVSASFIDLRFEVIPNKEWKLPVNGLYDPVRREIKIPNKVWKQLGYKSKAKKYQQRKMEALRVLFHELGHYFLQHEFKYFDEKSSPATQEEDAEYQADTFAEELMISMGVEMVSDQLTLFK